MSKPIVAAFPTEFPAEAAAKIGQAILNKSFGAELIEPAYDILGYALYKLFGSEAPFPRPSLYAVHGEFSEEEIGRLLVDASERPTLGATGDGKDKDVDALPWGLILSLAFTILGRIIPKK